MPIGILNPGDSGHATGTRPAATLSGINSRLWFSDPLNTEVRDQDLNAILAQIRYAIDHYSIPDVEGDDTLLQQAIAAGAGALTGNIGALQGLIGAADKVPYWTSPTVMSTFTATPYSRSLLAKTSLVQWQDALGISAFSSPNVMALSALAGGADQLPYFTGVGTMDQTPITAAARTLLDDASTTVMRSTLGLGTMALADTATYMPKSGGIFTGNIQGGGPATLWTLSVPTVDGLDSGGLIMAGGGAASSTRGAFVSAYGNEHATYPGQLHLASATGVLISGPLLHPLKYGAPASTFIWSANTVDGTDSAVMMIGGGGDATTARGAYLELRGNEAAAGAGCLDLRAGTAGTVKLNGTTFGAFATSTDLVNATGVLNPARITDGTLPLTKLGVINTDRLLGNNTGSNASPIALTPAQVKTMLDYTTADITGLAAIATTGSASDLTSGTVPDARISGAYTGITTLSLSTSITFNSNGILLRNTVDGSDTGQIVIAAASAQSAARSGYIAVYGNEHATVPGNVRLGAGVTGVVEVLGAMTLSSTLAVTGVATVPTAAPGTNTTQVATTAFVTAAISAVGYSAADVLAKLLTVDGAGSNLDADLLDGQSSAFYQSASNLNAGTLPDARLTGPYTGITALSISGVLTLPTTITFSSNGAIGRNTADGSDTGSVSIYGGGAAGSARGGSITAYGNEHASLPGRLSLIAGLTGYVDVAGAMTVSGILTVTGGQIAFPATQSGSADPNTLDDYEEGTWTPALTAGTTPPTGVTYGAQTGRYTKIGREVHVEFRVTTGSTGTGGVGPVRLTGLPFSTGGPVTSGLMRFTGITLPSSGTLCFLYATGASVTLQTSTNTAGNVDVQWSNLVAGVVDIIGSFSYSV